MKDDALSDFDVMRWHRLPNWGRWGRHDPDKPDCNRLSASICAAYIPSGEDKDYEAAPEAPPPPIDHRDADDVDGFMHQLMKRNKRQFEALGVFFYRRKLVSWDRLDEGIRSLLDLMDENRAAVDRMYALIYRGSNGSS